jgi:CubicO group peptidase (beta-lactamase class C family)
VKRMTCVIRGRLLLAIVCCYQISSIGCGGRDQVKSTPVTSFSAPAASVAEFESRVDQLRRDLNVPGLGVSIAKDQKIVWSKGLGLADREASLAPTGDTSFHLASLTKTYASTILLRLVEQGKVSLDDPVSKYGVSVQSSGIVTVRHLFTHTSESTPPGSAFHYNGDRYQLLQGVIEVASGQTFGSLLVTGILQPLQVQHTAPNVQDAVNFSLMGFDKAEFTRNLAKPYSVNGSTTSASAYPTQFGVAAGLISSANEVALYSMAIDRNAFLSPETQALAFTRASPSIPYGLGWFVQTIGGIKVVWHYGLWTSNSSLIIKVPSKGLTFVALANCDTLTSTVDLGNGDLMVSPVAREFVNAFVIGNTPVQ